jgi:3-isopropylmalate dehydratase small subunit
MKAFRVLTATAAPLLRDNIDTDVIIRIEKLVGMTDHSELGRWCFGALRYLPRRLGQSRVCSQPGAVSRIGDSTRRREFRVRAPF